MAKIAILSIYSGVVDRGVETFTEELGTRLASMHRVTIFQTTSSKSIHNSKNLKKIRFELIKQAVSIPKSSRGVRGKLFLDTQSLRILLFTLKALPKLWRGKYDVVVPLNGGWQTALLRIFTKITRAKMIISGHAGIGFDDAWNLLWRPDVFVALTTPQFEWAQKLTPEVRTEKIPNGVNLKEFNPKVSKADIQLEGPIVVCASALVPYKRVDLTIKAVAKSQKLSLLVLGDGELSGSIDSLGKRLLGTRYLRKVVKHDQIPSYLKAASVFTLVSKTEAFGISYIEALACNVPVVATNDPSRAEIIADAGLLTNPENIDQYAKDLTTASQKDFGNKPYNQALKFSWEIISQKYLDAIKSLR